MRTFTISTLLILFSGLAIISCNEPGKKENQAVAKQKPGTAGELKHGLVKTKKQGRLKTEVTYKKGLKHGPSKIYYDNSDQVMLEMNYVDGLREGKSTKYYQGE